jgi:cell fate (sporulation/competence/biofilm development) regulator YmcA (YheA/YmcA/DUF963 family)
VASKKKIRTVKLWPVITSWALAILFLAICAIGNQLSRMGLFADQPNVQHRLDFCADFARLMGLVAIALSVLAMITRISKTSEQVVNAVDNLRSLRSGQTQLEAMLTQISENLLLSDAIKTIAFREKDRAVLEDAIHQDMQMEKWDSAELLLKDLASRFGSPGDAENLRQEMIEFRNANIQEKLDKALSRIESLWSIHHYAEAEKQVAILQRIYPNQEKVKNLSGKTQMRLEHHKKELLARWDETIKNNKVDESIEVLELLDNYLTPTEAAALEESARGVFRAKLHKQGVQFSIFVTEKKWTNALKIGREIIDEFPNSRMAQEVRDKLMVLENKVDS